MLAKRIIPCLDVNNGRVVKGVNFLNLRDAGNPVSIITKSALVRRDVRFKKTKAILCSALRDRETIAQGATLGIEYYILNPF